MKVSNCLLGNLLDGSGWTHVLSNSMISSGKANTMLIASSNIVLCQYMHEITACSLYTAKREAYEICKKQRRSQEDILDEEWEI